MMAAKQSFRPANVFISYGRSDALEFVKRLSGDLQQHNCEVFVDLASIEKGGFWEVRIERGIKQSSVFLAVLSPHAVREESVCRDEVVFALNEGKRVVPVHQDPSLNLMPPLLLARRNWIDFASGYDQGLDALLRLLEGDDSALHPPALPTITGVVPMDFSVEIARFMQGFTGRDWLQQEIDGWLAKDGRRAMVIVAEPGVGKSAIAAWLSQTRRDVLGIHFCTQQNARTRDPYEFVACLVSHLHARLPGYAEAVEVRHPEVRRPDARAAFRELIIEPVRNLAAPDHACLIVVDSLDEALVQNGETVLDVLVDQVKDLPAWLRIIATSRPEQSVLIRIRALNVFELLAERPENGDDIQHYVVTRLQTPALRERIGAQAEAVQKRLAHLAEGNFLYVRLALDALEDGSLSMEALDDLSSGLVDFYGRAFARKFPDVVAYSEKIAPLLTVLSVARGPIPFGLLCRVAGAPRSEVNRRLSHLRSWLKLYGENDATEYALFHKSLRDWLVSRDNAGEYWCDPSDGHARLAGILAEAWPAEDYALRNLPSHLVALARWDEVVALLCDLRFVEARCAAGQVFELIGDYRLAQESLPEAMAELQKEREQKQRIQQWVDELISYAQQWSKRRDRLAHGEEASDPKPLLPTPPPSCRMWTEDEIEAESRRLIANPTRLDRIDLFARFVNSQCYPLLEHSRRPGFTFQHAFNAAPAGAVHEAGTMRISTLREPHLLRRWSENATANLRPALLWTLEGHGDGVMSVSVTPDGRWAVTGSYDKTMRVWDLETGTCLQTLHGHFDEIRSVSMTPDGRRAVTGCYDNTVRVWDMERGICLRTLEGHREGVGSVSVTPDGCRVVTGSLDHTVRIWNVESGMCLRTLEGHQDGVRSVSLTPDGCRAVTGSMDHTVRVWDLESGVCLRTMKGHSDEVRGVAVTPDGRRAVTGSWDKTVKVWDVESGECLQTLVGHSGGVMSVSVTPDGRQTVAGTDNNEMWIWDLKSGTHVRTLLGHGESIYSVNITADGRRAVTGSLDPTVRVWDLETGACLQMHGKHCDKVTSVCVAPDGRRVVTGSMDQMVRVWDVEAGACLQSLEGHCGRVTGVSVTPDGRRVVTGGWDKTVKIWDLESGVCVRTLEGLDGEILCLGVTSDGRQAVIGGESPWMQLWDLESGVCLRTLGGCCSGFRCIGVAQDGRRAITGSWDKMVRVWNLANGACLRTLEGHDGAVSCVSMMPDGRRVVTGSCDKSVRIWDVESGVCLRTLKGHGAEVRGVSVTPDGQHAVSGSLDHTVRVWELESGACLAVLQVAAPVGPTAVLSKIAAVGTDEGAVFFFDVRGVEASPNWMLDMSDEGYTKLLFRGLEFSRRERGSEYDEILAHLTALVVHLQNAGKSEEAAACQREHDELAAQIAAKKK